LNEPHDHVTCLQSRCFFSQGPLTLFYCHARPCGRFLTHAGTSGAFLTTSQRPLVLFPQPHKDHWRFSHYYTGPCVLNCRDSLQGEIALALTPPFTVPLTLPSVLCTAARAQAAQPKQVGVGKFQKRTCPCACVCCSSWHCKETST